MVTPAISQIRKQLNDQQELIYAWFLSMHTRIDIILYGPPEISFSDIADQMYQELQRLERIANYYDPQSELYKINEHAYSQETSLSEELYSMISTCMEQHKKTFGCFDISIKSQDYHKQKLESVLLFPDKQSISFKEKGTIIDLSGFLKGYALNKIKDILDSYLIKNALINIGNSSVLALGNHPYGSGWKVAFGNVSSTDDGQHVWLKDQFLTTSGNETEHRKHIISPETGKYIEGKKQIAVITEDGIEGEILSTSLFVATPSLRKELIDSFHVRNIYEM